MAEIRKGKVQRLVAYKLDRLGRSLSHLALILEELERNQVTLICTSQGISTDRDSAKASLVL
jgi:DNA invertase Pin-like site-specific DNA recombinase